MGEITLGGVTLYKRMAWINEYAESPVVYKTRYTLDGKMKIQSGIKVDGFSIILRGGPATRTLIKQLHTIQFTNVTVPLILQDGRTFDVRFDGSNAIKAVAVGDYHVPREDDYYELEIHLLRMVVE